jgi:tetratricopeptide (TPR) repeat protein
MGDLDAARQAAQETLTFVPDNIAAQQMLAHPPAQDLAFWLNRSLEQYRQAQYPQAIDSARHALQLDAHSAEAYINIGAGYGALHQWDLAIRNEQEALHLNPNLQLARNNLNWYQQESAAARTGSSAAIKPATLTANDWINTSLQLNQAGRYLESIAAARKALQLNPNSAEAWNNIAAGNESLRRWDDAIAAAKRAIALKPGYQLAQNNLSWSLAQKAARK